MKYSKPLQNLEEYMKLKRYSKNTIDLYFCQINKIINYSNNDVFHLTVKDFNEYILNNSQLSNSSVNLMVNAGKLFFKYGLKRKPQGKFLIRPRKETKIIEVLTPNEIWQIINSINHIKQKAIISGIYLHGLRISEILKLKYCDIDRKRGLLIIRQSKGKKDRLVPLHKEWLLFLTKYAISEGHKRGYLKLIFAPYSESSIRNTLKHNAKKVGIRKQLSPHRLRDAYASHLIESGYDISIIQEILGHTKLETTRKYIHFSATNISKVHLKLVS